MKNRKYLMLLLMPLLFVGFLSVTQSQLIADTSIISMAGVNWSLKVDSTLASSIDSRNTPYMTSKSATEKELFLELATLEDCKSGVVQFKIDMTGLTAYKQLPLTEKEILEGSFRPKNVENSFALFDSNGRKVAHIYGSKIIDAKGVEVWLDQDLNDGLLTVYLPDAKVLETLSFPLLLDPTFGFDSVGATTDTFNANYIFMYNVTLADDNVQVDGFNFYVAAAPASGRYIKCALYNTSGNFIVGTDAFDTWSSDWNWIPVNQTSPIIDSGTYLLAWITNIAWNDGIGSYLRKDSGGLTAYYASTYTNGLPATVTLTGATNSTAKWSYYANYTIIPEPTPTPTPSPSPSPTPHADDMVDTDWWISILLVVLMIVNLVIIVLPFALVRFSFGALAFLLSAFCLQYDVPLTPYMQTAAMVVSVVCMFLAARARE